MKPRSAQRKGSQVLLVVMSLLAVSGALRIISGAGPALARAEASAIAQEPDTTPSICESDTSENLIAALQAREDRVDQREVALADRLQALRVAEAEVTEKLQQLEAAEASLQATLATAESASDGDIATLVAVYENMKPADAAALFEEMDPSFAAGFFSRMRPEAAAAVMTGLEPATAYSISAVIAGRNANVPTE